MPFTLAADGFSCVRGSNESEISVKSYHISIDHIFNIDTKSISTTLRSSTVDAFTFAANADTIYFISNNTIDVSDYRANV